MGSFRINLTQAQADLITAALDGGAGPAVFKIYDENGAGVPADVSVAITTEVLLVTITLNDPSFAAAVDSAPNATIVLDVTPEPSATAVASAGVTPTLFGRFEDSNGVEHLQADSVDTSSAEVTINSKQIQSGATVKITGGSIVVKETVSAP